MYPNPFGSACKARSYGPFFVKYVFDIHKNIFLMSLLPYIFIRACIFLVCVGSRKSGIVWPLFFSADTIMKTYELTSALALKIHAHWICKYEHPDIFRQKKYHVSPVYKVPDI